MTRIIEDGVFQEGHSPTRKRTVSFPGEQKLDPSLSWLAGRIDRYFSAQGRSFECRRCFVSISKIRNEKKINHLHTTRLSLITAGCAWVPCLAQQIDGHGILFSWHVIGAAVCQLNLLRDTSSGREKVRDKSLLFPTVVSEDLELGSTT